LGKRINTVDDSIRATRSGRERQSADANRGERRCKSSLAAVRVWWRDSPVATFRGQRCQSPVTTFRKCWRDSSYPTISERRCESSVASAFGERRDSAITDTGGRRGLISQSAQCRFHAEYATFGFAAGIGQSANAVRKPTLVFALAVREPPEQRWVLLCVRRSERRWRSA